MSQPARRTVTCAAILFCIVTLAFAALRAPAADRASAAAAAAAGAGAADPDPFAVVGRLGRGVNVIGYDPLWRDRSRARFKPQYFKMLRDAGFNHVRFPLHPFRDARPGPDHKLSDNYLRTLDWAVDEATRAGLMVIVDFHEFTAMARDPEGLKGKWLAGWQQIAERLKGAPDTVLFELLNEPNSKLTPDLWNKFLVEALAVVRASNPRRTVIVGPASWNGIGHLKELALPEDDRNLIVTVHFYNPFEFTHQGAPWTNRKDQVGIPWEGTEKERQAITRQLDVADAWARERRRPVYLGEFGAYDKADMASRVRWTGFVARQAEARGWAWGYWQFDGDFILYDVKAERWVEPIRDALVPPKGN